jgi:hypothetical protein
MQKDVNEGKLYGNQGMKKRESEAFGILDSAQKTLSLRNDCDTVLDRISHEACGIV